MIFWKLADPLSRDNRVNLCTVAAAAGLAWAEPGAPHSSLSSESLRSESEGPSVMWHQKHHCRKVFQRTLWCYSRVMSRLEYFRTSSELALVDSPLETDDKLSSKMKIAIQSEVSPDIMFPLIGQIRLMQPRLHRPRRTPPSDWSVLPSQSDGEGGSVSTSHLWWLWNVGVKIKLEIWGMYEYKQCTALSFYSPSAS